MFPCSHSVGSVSCVTKLDIGKRAPCYTDLRSRDTLVANLSEEGNDEAEPYSTSYLFTCRVNDDGVMF